MKLGTHTLSLIVITLSFTVVLSSCKQPSLSIDQRAKLPVASTWTSSIANETGEIQPWQEDIEDQGLHDILNYALKNSYELQITAARMESAIASASFQGSSKWPELSIKLDSARHRRNNSTGFRVTDFTIDSFSLATSINWEIDLWGRLANNERAAFLDYEATKAELNAARLSLSAQIARLWFSLIEKKQQTILANKTVKNLQEHLQTIEAGFAYNLFNQLDVSLAKTDLANAENRAQSNQLDFNNSLRTLEALVGMYPSADINIPDRVPPIKRHIPTGLPSELLTRRPDILQAQYSLLATDQRLQSAKKAFLPQFTLTGLYGTSTSQFSDLLDLDFLIWSITGAITQTLFDGGKRKHSVEIADAATKEAIARYGQIALRAFQEVESALDAETILIKQEALLNNAKLESHQAVNLAQEQYVEGLVDIITLLESQRRAYDAESNLITIQSQRLQNRINLYVALGGGFDLTLNEI